MQVVEALEGEVILVNGHPVAIERARGNVVRLVTVDCIEESEQDLRQFLKRRRNKIDRRPLRGQNRQL